MLLALTAAMATALAHVLAKDVLKRLDLGAFVVLRLLAAFLAVTGLLLWRDPSLGLAFPERQYLLPLVLVSMVCPLAVNLLLFAGYARLPVSHAVPMFHIYPALMAVLGPLLFGHTWDWAGIPGILVILVGTVAFVRRGSDENTHAVHRTGVAAVFLAALGNAIAALVWTDLRAGVDPLVICWWGTGCSTVMLLPWAMHGLRRWRWGNRRVMAEAAASGVLIFGLANACAIAATAQLAAPTVFALVATTVLWTGLMARVRLGERWSRLQTGAALLVVFGIVMLGWR